MTTTDLRVSTFKTGQAFDKFADSPNTYLSYWPEGARYSLADSFETYLMFRPKDGQWVPLKMLTWGWEAVVRNVGNEDQPNWTLVSSANLGPSAATETSVHPEWQVWVNTGDWYSS